MNQDIFVHTHILSFVCFIIEAPGLSTKLLQKKFKAHNRLKCLAWCNIETYLLTRDQNMFQIDNVHSNVHEDMLIQG